MTERVKKTIDALKQNNFAAYYVDKKEEVCDVVKTLLAEGEKVACGGSVSLQQAKVIDLLKSGKYVFLDRSVARNDQEKNDIMLQGLMCDTYFCSSNAVTVNGELYNVDGNSNRVASILYGPKSVIMVVGINKIVDNIKQAEIRVKTIAAPLNTRRLNCNTYCAETGKCVSCNNHDSEIPGGCRGDGRICCNYVISARQRVKDRIKVILVGEDLGY